MALHDAGADPVLHGHVGGEVRGGEAQGQLAEGDLQGLGRLGAQGQGLGAGPVGAGLQGRKDGLDRALAEGGVELGAVRAQGRGARIHMKLRQQGLDIDGIFRQRHLQLGEPFGGHMVRRQARVETVGGLDPGPGQGEPETDPTGQTGQEPPPSDVREEADAGLGHGEGRALGGEAVAGRGREADAAAHGDPVHHRDDRLRIGKEQMIQSVLGEKEGARQAAVVGAAVGQHADIAPGAEAALAGMVDQHRLDGRIAAPV